MKYRGDLKTEISYHQRHGEDMALVQVWAKPLRGRDTVLIFQWLPTSSLKVNEFDVDAYAKKLVARTKLKNCTMAPWVKSLMDRVHENVTEGQNDNHKMV